MVNRERLPRKYCGVAVDDICDHCTDMYFARLCGKCGKRRPAIVPMPRGNIRVNKMIGDPDTVIAEGFDMLAAFQPLRIGQVLKNHDAEAE